MRHEENSSRLGDSVDVVAAIAVVDDAVCDISDDLLPASCTKLASSNPTARTSSAGATATSCSNELLGTKRNVTKSE
jgi:hypothetical protein